MLTDKRPFQVLIMVCFSILLFTHLSQFDTTGSVARVTRFGRAGDFVAYRDSAASWKEGKSPYAPKFHPVTPPALSIAMVPFTYFPKDAGADFFQMTIVLGTIFLAFLFGRSFHQTDWAIFILLLFWLTSNPTEFLIDRGNAEFLTLFLFAMAFYLLEKNKGLVAAVLMGIAIGFKPNIVVALPAFLMAPTLRKSAYRLVPVVLVVAVLWLATPHWTADWLQVISRRAGWKSFGRDNLSVFRVFADLPGGNFVAGAVLYGTYFTVLAGLYQRRHEATRPFLVFFSILPFTATFIRTQYLYGMYLFPLLVFHYLRAEKRGLRILGFLALGLMYFPVGYYENRYGGREIPRNFVFLICALGSLGLILTNAGILFPDAKKFVWRKLVR